MGLISPDDPSWFKLSLEFILPGAHSAAAVAFAVAAAYTTAPPLLAEAAAPP